MKNRYNVLFIDDSKIDISYIETMLDIEELPIDACFSPNALQALEHLAVLDPKNFPQAIIIDINMPLMDGFGFVEEYKKKFHAQHSETLLYISSSTYRLSEIEKAKKMNIVQDFVGKPIQSSFFETHIFPLIDKVQT